MACGAVPPLLLRLLVSCLLVPLSSPTAVPSSAALSTATTGPGTGVDAGSEQTADIPRHSTPRPSQTSPDLGDETLPPGSSPGPSSPTGSLSPGPTPGAASSGPSPNGAAETPVPSEPAILGTTPRPGPWPAPVTDVVKLCVCDLLVDQCDANCCCDPICTAVDFNLFTECSVPVVTGGSQLCRQQEALYAIDPVGHPPERLFQLADKVNPSVFCIQMANYKSALAFRPPEVPTLYNFDRLLQEFGGDTFGIKGNLALTDEFETQHAANVNGTSSYEYKDLIQTSDGFLRLPAPLLLSWCAHSNPAGFLVNQAVKCNTMIKEDDCTTVPGLSMQFYTRSSILTAPTSSQMVNITIQSITVQTVEGLRMRLYNTDASMLPTLNGQLCSNVVLEASYLITFTEAGEITGAAVSLVLATVNTAARFVLQIFEIRFLQQDAQPVHLSGSPGYVAGLPIKAGFRSAGSGVIQSRNEDGQLTIMKSTSAQDCLAVEGVRTPVLFGYSMMSGCQLRITQDADCRLLTPVLLNVLKGQNFPDCVASFGDSLPQNGLDWVQISYNVTKPVPSGSERTIQLFSSATFVDVSAAAEPGYKARPTVEANLPFDFFFPFI
ncbi:tectonic-1 isoform X2 [Rhineura floridana]|uniref:tectonic-1 isoform X2 n=1 Tax=Rhineura floridana TaxID=261503 RepID=UPI002AC84463|nr:tectonic-1 isoform X2 [Rhineura floridana]